MDFVSTPIEFKVTDTDVTIDQHAEDDIQMLDNLVELIIFTPKGSFSADPDFGFEYWNHEYSNIHYKEFNNNHYGLDYGGLHNETTRKECQESVKRSLDTYASILKHVDVSIGLEAIDECRQHRNVFSKYEVSVKVIGVLDDGLGTVRKYEKRVVFFMEPIVKQATI